MQHVMKLREMHRTVTWLFLNVITLKQHALSITAAWPWWSRPLTSECSAPLLVRADVRSDQIRSYYTDRDRHATYTAVLAVCTHMTQTVRHGWMPACVC
jgi:hypothetical protein